MVQIFFYFVGLLLLGVVIYIVIAARTAYKEANYRKTKIDWASAQLERALAQTRSNDETKVLAGIQCLSTLNIPEIRFKALHRLDELTQHEDPLIVEHAESAMVRLSKSTAQAEC
jgi:hypothetical protein